MKINNKKIQLEYIKQQKKAAELKLKRLIPIEEHLTTEEQIKIEELERNISRYESMIQEAYDDAIHVLINSAEVATDINGEIYEQLYYLVELGELVPIYTKYPGKTNLQYNAIDFSKFFSEIGISKNFKEHRTAIYSALWAKGIMEEIVEYLFAKNKFESWDEVREKLDSFKDNHKRPLYHEQREIYKVRALTK